MNANNQTSSSVKQIKLQLPIPILYSFLNSVNELYKMYPIEEKKNGRQCRKRRLKHKDINVHLYIIFISNNLARIIDRPVLNVLK